MNALTQEIASIIAQEGPISVERYMQLCLAHPQHGYYMTRDPLGAAGDFITSPEISQMFGELLGLWAAETWALCGAPQPARLVELGPGRGTLMADALRAARVVKPFYESLQATLVETSPALIEAQRAMLADMQRPLDWKNNVEDLPHAPTIVLANEFFDALPVRQYVKTSQGWRERQVGLSGDGAFVFGGAPQVEPYLNAEAPDGAIIEVGAIGQRIMYTLATRIVQYGGALLVIDYGHEATSTGETLQAMRAHRYADPLSEAGECDLTTHVDFAGLARAAKSVGAQVHGPVSQGFFLRQLGIERRADALARQASADQAKDIATALHRLTDETQPTDMGRLFRVMAVTRKGAPQLPGFATGASA
ncbi:MAG: SAM-dependent methyltransferase [Hyphomicrobiales bacterium]|nr:SAM-dependent methyltransferase [Hyphomicrobiales bacterium]